MAGCVIDATPIAVDFWKPTKAPQVRLFFLTHLHSDHIEGLTSSWRLPLYTSPITALLLKNKFKLPDSVVHELEVGHSFLIPLDEGSNNTITVTVIDANHVPGAVMFLFQGYFGNILYCGDMRWDPEMLEDPVLRDVVQQRALDVLYLDNTYSAPYCQFPSREEAKQQIFKIIDMYPDHEIKIGINTLGREKLLEDIAKRYGERILVSQEKYVQLQLLGCFDVFTTDPQQSRIHTVPMKQMQVSSHKKWNEKYQTISIIPSALYSGWKNGPYSSQASTGMHVVPYSDHSSYSELMEMVSQLAPHQIFPIVKYFSKSGWWADQSAPDQNIKADMTVYRHLLSTPPPDPVIIPEDVIKLMDRKAPRLLQARPRRCVLRHGLSPRRSKVRGVVFSSGSCSSPSLSRTPSVTPTSFTTLGSGRSDFHSPRRADFRDSPRSMKSGVRYPSHSVIGNELHSEHVLNESNLKRSTPMHFTDSHKSARMVNEEDQPTNSRNFASKRKNYRSKQQPREHTSSARSLSIELQEKVPSNEVEIDLKRKKKPQNVLTMRRDALLRETIDFIKIKNEEMNSLRTCSSGEELRCMLKNANLILDSLSCLDFVL
ncbi:5' exonuclease Apollo-like isoform X1 [Scylla paramamosain]|uniref:5' exonuclease Apollo-like isoform X1 n=2 Tax=Scylla paramamosain TaxID=85552 RepID=UPI0030826E11